MCNGGGCESGEYGVVRGGGCSDGEHGRWPLRVPLQRAYVRLISFDLEWVYCIIRHVLGVADVSAGKFPPSN